MPVLIAVGEKDKVAGSAAALAALIPGAEVLIIPNRDHMLATGDRAFKAGVLDFLGRHGLPRLAITRWRHRCFRETRLR